jgi:hypothetical protein
MQNRYVGDVGDFVKLAILRALVSEDGDRKLGIAWWLFPDESHNADGKHRAYLDQPGKWKLFDPVVFEALDQIRSREPLNVVAIEEACLFRDAIYAGNLVPGGEHPISSRSEKRAQWFQDVEEKLRPCNVVFLDPDNGIASPGWKVTQKRAGKSVTFDDLKRLRRAVCACALASIFRT